MAATITFDVGSCDGVDRLPSLAELLNLIGPDGAELYWTVYELEASGDHGRWQWADTLGNAVEHNIEAAITAAPHGIPVSWAELVQLGALVHQVIWFFAIGTSAPAAIPKRDEQRLLDESTIVIQMFDGGEWQLFSRCERVAERLVAAYPQSAMRRDAFMW